MLPAVSPLKVDAETDALISHGAHFLHMTKKELVSVAVREFVSTHQAELEKGVKEAAATLNGTHLSKVALLSGLSPDEVDALGGVKP